MTGQNGLDVTVTTTQEPLLGPELDLVPTLLLLVMGTLVLGNHLKLTTVSNNVSTFILKRISFKRGENVVAISKLPHVQV